MRAPVLLSATVFAAILLFSSCKKEEAPATPVERLDFTTPNRYNPTYPGSWWKYLQYDTSGNVTDTVVVTVDLFAIEFDYWNAQANQIDNQLYCVMATTQNGEPYLSDRILHYCENAPDKHRFWSEIFLDTTKANWLSSCSCTSSIEYAEDNRYEGEFVPADTVQNVTYNHVLKIYCQDFFPHVNGGPPRYTAWYAGDVGMIRQEVYFLSYPRIARYTLELIDYHINH